MPTKTSIDDRLFKRLLTKYTGKLRAFSGAYIKRDYVETKIGSGLPNWREKVKKRENATTPYTVEATKVVGYSPASLAVTGVYGPMLTPNAYSELFEGINNVPPIPSHNVVDAQIADSKALTALYRKVDSQISQAKVPSALVEFGDVIRQFGSPARAILGLTERHLNRLYLQRRGIHALRYNREKLSKVLSDTYLEYAFGLAPLINDSKSAAEALARWVWETDPSNSRIPPIKLVGRASVEASNVILNTGLPFANPGDGLSVKYTRRTSTTARCQYIAGYSTFLTADLGSHARLVELLGFRPEQWIPAAWEAVPWSWLIDYFSNVNDILDSLAASKIHPTWLCKTTTVVTEQEQEEQINMALTTPVLTNNGVRNLSYLQTPGLLKCRRTTMVRSIPTSLGLPSLYYELPSSLTRLANMSAVLLSQQSSPPMISLEKNYRNFLKSR